MTPTASRQTQLPFGGGTSSEEWAFRKGIQEARTTGSTELRRYFAQLGWGAGSGMEEARLGKYLTDLGVEEAEGLAGIRERYQNELRRQMGQFKQTGGTRVRVLRKGSRAWLIRELEKAGEKEGGY